jgi:hypothetical protein
LILDGKILMGDIQNILLTKGGFYSAFGPKFEFSPEPKDPDALKKKPQAIWK